MNVMSLSEVLDRSIDTLRKNLKTIVLFNLVYGIISGIIAFIFMMFGILTATFTAILSPSTVGIVIAISIITMVVVTFIASINVGIIEISAEQYTGSKMNLQNAITNSLKSLPKIFVILLLVAIAALPIVLFFWKIIEWMIENVDLEVLEYDITGIQWIIIIVVPLLILLISAFIMMVYYTVLGFSFQVATIEKKGPIASIKRSFILVRRNFWKLFGYNILFFLTVMGIRYSLESIVGLILGIIYLVGKLFSVNQEYTILFASLYGVMAWPINILTWLIVTPIGGIMSTLLYFNQRFKKEGLDIELKLKVLENTMKESS